MAIHDNTEGAYKRLQERKDNILGRPEKASLGSPIYFLAFANLIPKETAETIFFWPMTLKTTEFDGCNFMPALFVHG